MLFLVHFCAKDIVFKKSRSVMHNTTWAPLHHAEFKKKLMSQFQENYKGKG